MLGGMTEVVRGDRVVSSHALVRVSWGVVALCLLGLLANAFVWLNAAEDSCTAGDGSTGGSFGTVGWSWLPPGQTCTYELHGAGQSAATTVTTGGSWYLVTTVLLVLVCVALLLSSRRRIEGARARA